MKKKYIGKWDNSRYEFGKHISVVTFDSGQLILFLFAACERELEDSDIFEILARNMHERIPNIPDNTPLNTNKRR